MRLTQKGKGFAPAMEQQKKFHGLGAFDPETGATKAAAQKTYSESVCGELDEAGE